MSTMNISLPASLKSFVDEQVDSRGFSTCSEYVRQLIRRDQDRRHLRDLLLEGAASKPAAPDRRRARLACLDEARIGLAQKPGELDRNGTWRRSGRPGPGWSGDDSSRGAPEPPYLRP